MKRNLTLKFYALLATVILTVSGMYAQQLNSTGLYRHGTNSASSGAVVAPEATDSVTVSGTLDYFVMPDPLYSPSYVPATSLTANLNSTFTWTTSPAGPTITTKTGFLTNYVTVAWPSSTGTYNLNVTENSVSGCNGDTRTIPVMVISKPTAGYSSASSTQCSATPASESFTLPLSLTSQVAGGRLFVDFSVVYTPTAGLPTTTAYNNVALLNGGNINLETLIGSNLAYGSYQVTITAVRDHISVKSNITGVIGTTSAYTFNLIRLPKTGEIYHVPNI